MEQKSKPSLTRATNSKRWRTNRRPLDPGCGDLDELLIFGNPETRRQFIKQIAGTGVAITIGVKFVSASGLATERPAAASPTTTGSDSVQVKLKINGKDYAVDVDPRTTLLDTLRERLHLTGSKKDAITASAARARFWLMAGA